WRKLRDTLTAITCAFWHSRARDCLLERKMEVSAVAELESLTPMMRQYHELKEKAQDAILFFRMGDFYEIFGADALEVAPRLELVLTSRERGDNNRIPFCGVPHHSAKNYWLKLLKY